MLFFLYATTQWLATPSQLQRLVGAHFLHLLKREPLCTRRSSALYHIETYLTKNTIARLLVFKTDSQAAEGFAAYNIGTACKQVVLPGHLMTKFSTFPVTRFKKYSSTVRGASIDDGS